MLEIGRSQDTGLTLIKAAGHYYQRIHNLSDPTNPQEREFRGFYEFPYRATHALNNVAIVGAGTGFARDSNLTSEGVTGQHNAMIAAPYHPP
jgi:hypothetical protein